jgi:hypothetical protein
MWRKEFLMVGQRWNVDIKELVNFDDPNWEYQLQEHVKNKGVQAPPQWIDYFVFRSGIFREIPPFTVGRTTWDNWLIWRAVSKNIPVVDASSVAIVIHQNHGYSHHPMGERGVWQGEEAKRNYELAGGWTCSGSILSARYRLTSSGIVRNWTIGHFKERIELTRRWIIDLTRPIRHRLGLRLR